MGIHKIRDAFNAAGVPSPFHLHPPKNRKRSLSPQWSSATVWELLKDENILQQE